MAFLNELFLVGAATAMAPILIHLIQRRRAQQVVFSSLRLLRRTSHRVVRRRRFAELLLVLLRALALAILAVAFARPFFAAAPQQDGDGETAAGLRAALVLVDNSYSMRAEGRLERAKEEALKFLREVDPDTQVGVGAYSSQLEELCPVGPDAGRAEQAVKGIEPSWRGTNLALVLKRADRILTRSGRQETDRRIVLIGDFQDGSWQDRGDAALTPGTELTVRNVAAKTVPNVHIVRLAVPRLVVAGGFVEVISATIRNGTDRPLNDAPVTFKVGGEQKAVRRVNLRPREEALVRFRHKFTEPGDAIGSITVGADDPLPHDNTAHFCVPVTPRVHVLLVNADRSEKMVLNDGLFVQTALVPGVEDLASPFEVRQIAPEKMKVADLDGVDVVLFINVSKLPAAMSSPLDRFVADGGGIGFLCGSKVIAEEFNRTFDGLAPCRLLRRAMRKGDPAVVINQTDLRHEIFAEFARPHSGDFSLAEFSQYFLVTDSLSARVPARFSNADAHPALLEQVFGPRVKGKSILFVSSLDLEWNNLCLKSVFVPFVHQLVKRLCARRSGSVRNFVVGEDVVHPVPQDAGDVTLRRLAEGSKPEALKVKSVGAVTFRPQRPGIYELSYAGGSARFAVNLDPKEPDLRAMDTRLLQAAVRGEAASRGKRPTGAAPAVAGRTARERIEDRQKTWQYLLLAMLVVLAIEMLLAGRIGRA